MTSLFYNRACIIIVDGLSFSEVVFNSFKFVEAVAT